MPRVDKQKNLSKVATEYISNPLQTEREVANNTWVSKSSVNRLKNELGQIGAKSSDIQLICDKDKENVMLWQAELNRRLQEQPSKLKTNDIVQIMNEWTKRYALFKSDLTDENGWLKKIDWIKIEIG